MPNTDLHIIGKFPSHIINIIKNYIWGDNDSWSIIYNKTLSEYNDIYALDIYNDYYIISKLQVCLWQKRLNKDIEIDDNFYCSVCGEKTLFFAFLFNASARRDCLCIL
jgi:hypothetical protein